MEARDVVPIGQQRTEPIAARIVIQIAVRDADQIEQLRTEPIVVQIVWQTEAQGVVLIGLQEIEQIAGQIVVLVQTDLLVVVQPDRDSAPVVTVADFLVFAQLAESVMFVVRSGRTEKAVAQEAVRRLRRVGAKVRGVVLNDFDPGYGSYSSDRYSVSHYKIITPKRPGADTQTPDDRPDSPRRAMG